MNYYEHHIGDYAEATAHLSILEDGVYSRLIRKYYATERALPADPPTTQRLIGARTKDERAAVEMVLQEFFELREDGWHQERCDKEIARYLEAEPERQAKQENAKERQRRARQRRKQMFDTLRSHGIVPSWDAPVTELETLLSRVTKPNGHAPVTGNVTPVTQPVTRDVTASHSHSPIPTPQSPLPNTHTLPDSEAEKGSVCGTFTKVGGEGRQPKPRDGPIPSVDEVMDQLRKEHGRAGK